jgi:hypothetical protein
MLWYHWWNLVCELRPACARSRTFLWMSLCLAGFSTRKDLLGVTSIVRALGLEPACYDRLLDFFHSPTPQSRCGTSSRGSGNQQPLSQKLQKNRLTRESACPTKARALAHQRGTDAFVCQPGDPSD